MSVQSPDTPNTGAIEDKTLDKESVIEFLGDEKEPETLELEEPAKKGEKDKPEKGEKKDKGDEKEEELSLEEELEKELEEPSEEELDLVAPPSRREILTKYPTLFKDFPHIERSIYREQKYSEILPTIEDAKLAVEKSNLMESYEKDMSNGSTESLLTAVRDGDREAFNKVVDNYLPNLYKVDQAAYYHTIGNVIKHTVISMLKDSKERSDDELVAAAAILNNFIFGTTQLTQPTKLSREPVGDENKDTEISSRERAFVEKQFTTARDTLGTTVDNIIKATVDKAIDPNESMPAWVKKNATREVLEELETAFQKDTRFRAIFDKLWEKAFTTNFDSESMDRIRKAYLSKAKTLLPYLIKKSRSEALRGLRKGDDTDNKDKRGHLPVGKTRSSTTQTSGTAKGNSKPVVPRGMTSLEFLNSDD